MCALRAPKTDLMAPDLQAFLGLVSEMRTKWWFAKDEEMPEQVGSQSAYLDLWQGLTRYGEAQHV